MHDYEKIFSNISTWRKFSFIPMAIVIGTSIYACKYEGNHYAHTVHSIHEGTTKPKRKWTQIRAKEYPWGDGEHNVFSFFNSRRHYFKGLLGSHEDH